MKKLIREHIKRQVKKILEDRSYSLEKLSPRAHSAAIEGSISGLNSLNIPPSAITDIKILKSTRPIFRVFFENEQYIDIIENPHNTEVSIDNLIFDLNDVRDYNAAQKEVERVMTMGKMPSEEPTETPEEVPSTEEPSLPSPEKETPTEEPLPEEPPA